MLNFLISLYFSMLSFFRKKGFIPSPLPLAPKKSPLFTLTGFAKLHRQSRGEPRYSLSSFALAVALLPPYSQSYAPREGREWDLHALRVTLIFMVAKSCFATLAIVESA
ncbi:hypothetical protein [Helicobacter trogontum]|uniref:hypothetical protein n=2 Tax=Helicobacter TaxID=209 RepID=UPI00242EDFA0|nr:hypothetical protein [Helicobacter trogontum]